MNLTALSAAVDRHTGVAFDATALTAVINEALAAISTQTVWPWLVTLETLATTSGVGTVTPGASWNETLSLVIDTYPPLREESRGQLDEWFTNSADRGVPAYYTVDADVLVLRPIPDGVYSITHRFVRSETDLSSGSDSPLMPAAFHNVIVEWASALVCDRMGDVRRSQVFMARADDWLKRMRNNARRVSAPARVRTRAGGWI